MTQASVLAPAPRPVPHDAPPAGLGYPPPTAYRRHPVTGVPTPPRVAPGRRSRAATQVPLAIAVAGAAVALVGTGSQLPGLVDAVTTTSASAPGTAGPTPSASGPAVARQCATVVADALDETVTTLGGTPSGQWRGVVDGRRNALAATYGDASPEHRAYAAGADDILAWLRSDADDWDGVTTRVARTVATTCAG